MISQIYQYIIAGLFVLLLIAIGWGVYEQQKCAVFKEQLKSKEILLEAAQATFQRCQQNIAAIEKYTVRVQKIKRESEILKERIEQLSSAEGVKSDEKVINLCNDMFDAFNNRLLQTSGNKTN
jgi:fructose-1,6-bisphosphatase